MFIVGGGRDVEKSLSHNKTELQMKYCQVSKPTIGKIEKYIFKFFIFIFYLLVIIMFDRVL